MIRPIQDVDLDRLARLLLGYLVEPANRELGQLIRERGPVSALGSVLAGHASAGLCGAVAARLGAEKITGSARDLSSFADRAETRAARLGIRIITPDDAEWPTQVDDLVRISRPGGLAVDRDTDPPLCLWVRGAMPLNEATERSVAVVGARAETPYGGRLATELAYDLASRQWTIVSGGAFGIDASAHRGALAAGGTTVTVLACGLDRPYPAAHASLFDSIAEHGLLISEWPPGAAPYRQRFLTRNRVIAASTLGTVVVEAGLRSGARHTLGRARLLGRSTMAVPGPVGSAMSAGCHVELRDLGTRLVTSVDEIVEEIGPVGALAPIPRGAERPRDALDPAVARLLDGLLPGPARSAETIAAEVGVSGRDARRGLPLLVAGGFAIQVEGRYRLAPAGRLDEAGGDT
ncbi:MAG: DNA-protecting protein DprA [Dactylosporangium sp.]|nr:DNA-processing protein DprA [Dactylosporangium sp.]NNJ59940.1 DNA-protecting protein DprA [Dactylosporangium sp.]